MATSYRGFPGASECRIRLQRRRWSEDKCVTFERHMRITRNDARRGSAHRGVAAGTPHVYRPKGSCFSSI